MVICPLSLSPLSLLIFFDDEPERWRRRRPRRTHYLKNVGPSAWPSNTVKKFHQPLYCAIYTDHTIWYLIQLHSNKSSHYAFCSIAQLLLLLRRLLFLFISSTKKNLIYFFFLASPLYIFLYLFFPCSSLGDLAGWLGYHYYYYYYFSGDTRHHSAPKQRAYIIDEEYWIILMSARTINSIGRQSQLTCPLFLDFLRWFPHFFFIFPIFVHCYFMYLFIFLPSARS